MCRHPLQHRAKLLPGRAAPGPEQADGVRFLFALLLERMLLLSPLVTGGLRPLQAGPQVQVAAQGGEHLYLKVGDRLGGGGQGGGRHGAVEKGVGGIAAGRVGGFPVGLQVVSQVLTGILQLVLIQYDVKELLES